MKTIKWLLVVIVLIQAIQTAVLWYGLLIYPYEDEDVDNGGTVQQAQLSPPIPSRKVAKLTGFLQSPGHIQNGSRL